MKPPTNTRLPLSSSDKTKIMIVLIFLGILAIILIALLAFLFRGNLMQLATRATHTPIIPTPICIEPTLKLGTAIFHVKTVPNNPNAFPLIPQDTADTAYWVEGTTVNYVFGLSPIGNNLALNTSLKTGDPMEINWGDCSKDEYILNSLDMVQPNELSLFDQSSGGITVYVQTDSSNLIIRGERPGTQTESTPLITDSNAAQFDIEFLEDVPPSDPSNVIIGMTITNRRTNIINLTNDDLSLTPENGQEIFPLNIDPVLPQEIQPEANLTLYVTFPRPQGSSAILRVLDTTLDYYFP